ncbi:MAG: 3-hydroxyacyl-CoA dehydrogenase NAD-binding domain-containing protein [Anaerolineales bacterium]|nr:3-hydroxyacyl-CoA dehydrogenase NAD-binding domain-containing protein [Anaerolineales bacterium]
MQRPIRSAVVLGAGTMGAQIAAHLANAGVATSLLDIVPRELTDEEEAAGLTREDRQVRNRLAREGLEQAKRAEPAAFFTPDKAEWIRIGNFEDDLDAVSDADWVLEAVVENLEIKRELMARVDDLLVEGTIVSTNTSGIPIHDIAEGRSETFRSYFLGTHFFNPPRYLRLLEIIPTEDTSDEVVERVKSFSSVRLGKGVVECKDTPNFIANRLGSVSGAFVMDYALEHGYGVKEIDSITGPLIGRPKTATFRLLDLVGLDVAMDVRSNLAEALPEDEAIEYLTSERAERLTSEMLERGWLGNKTGQGFYKGVEQDGEKEYWPLNLESLEYEAPEEVRFDSVGEAKDLSTPAERIEALMDADDRAADFIRAMTLFNLSYASKRIPEIADTPRPIDNAMRWGFQHDAGPFELWDQLDVAETVERMNEHGYEPAGWVEEMLESGFNSFYQYEDKRRVGVYKPEKGDYVPLALDPKRIQLPQLKAEGAVIEENDGASLVDLGDGVACLEFHTKGNSIDEDVMTMFDRALDRVERDWLGLVIGNEADNFSLGANLFTIAVAAQNELWDQLDEAVTTLQSANMRMRHFPKPIVVAPAGRTLGGGTEIAMHAPRVVAAAESYIGLVEAAVGVIPAGGGSKEMVRRVVNPVAEVENGDVLPPLQEMFERVGQAEVARSAAQARQHGFLGPADRIVMNREHLLAEAKREVLHMAPGYQPPDPEKIYAAGRDANAALKVGIFSFVESGYISEYDAHIGRKLAHVLTGGNLSQPGWVDPWYMLDLEREAFLSLAGEEKTQARMWHMLQEGSPLRN